LFEFGLIAVIGCVLAEWRIDTFRFADALPLLRFGLARNDAGALASAFTEIH